jgi:hypothetical protein
VVVTEPDAGEFSIVIGFRSPDEVRQRIRGLLDDAIESALDQPNAPTPPAAGERASGRTHPKARDKVVLALVDTDNKEFRLDTMLGRDRLEQIAARIRADFARPEGWAQWPEAERGAFVDQLQRGPEASRLQHDLFDEVEKRVVNALGDDGASSAWPPAIHLTAETLSQCLREIKKFHEVPLVPKAGGVLTPVVNAIRIRGPFAPAWRTETGSPVRWVVFDGQGHNHGGGRRFTHPPDDTRPVHLAVFKAFNIMQEDDVGLLREEVGGGRLGGLILVASAFDAMLNGAVDDETVEAHRDNLEQAVRAAINSRLGLDEADAVRVARLIDDGRLLPVSYLNEKLDGHARDEGASAQRLEDLLKRVEEIARTPPPRRSEFTPWAPSLDDDRTRRLADPLAIALKRYVAVWDQLLGFAPACPDIQKPAHWASVKALSRKMAAPQDEDPDYTRGNVNLMPIADLLKGPGNAVAPGDGLAHVIAKALRAELGWQPVRPPPEIVEAWLDEIRKELSQNLRRVAERWLVRGGNNSAAMRWGFASVLWGSGASYATHGDLNELTARFGTDGRGLLATIGSHEQVGTIPGIHVFSQNESSTVARARFVQSILGDAVKYALDPDGLAEIWSCVVSAVDTAVERVRRTEQVPALPAPVQSTPGGENP